MHGYKVEQRGRRVVLPAAENPNYGQQFSTFDADETIESFVYASRSGRLGIPARIKVGLVHRSDNTYNPNAISVVTPADMGGSVDQRHLGFFYDDDLRKIGSGRLPALIWYAGGEVECWAIFDHEVGLELDLPDFDVLGSAIGEFLCSRGVVPDKIDPQSILKTTETLDLLHSHSGPRGTIVGVVVSMAYSFDVDAWTLDLHELTTGQHLGTVQDATLFLVDERDRHAVLRHLAAQDIPVRQPIPAPPETISGSWSFGEIPSVRAEWDQGAIRLGCASALQDHAAQDFAVFNSRTGVLWVEDRRLVDVASLFASRLALDVRRVRTPQDPWGMDRELGWEDLYGPEAEEPSIESIDWWAKPQLLPQQHQTVSRGILKKLVTFSGVPDPAAAQAGDAWFMVPYRFDPGRNRLFPERTLLGSSAPCRLCGAVALVFTTPISTEELRYCHTCLRHASSGLEGTLKQAARAVQVIVETEFDGDLFLEGQLEPLHINPTAPVPACNIDRALLLRFAIGRGRFSWTRVLEATGLMKEGLRTSRGVLIRARDGHLCLSLREKAVCDFLHICGISHDREPKYPSDPVYNSNGLRRADWVLADGTLVEFWGMPNDPAYAAKMVEKRELAVRLGLRLVELVDGDLPNLPDIFAEWSAAGVDSKWEWSPRLLVSQQTQDAAVGKATRARPAGKAEGRKLNAASVAARDDRIKRCRRAIQLQAEGWTRATIAEELGLGSNAVKELLRDGRFYANPSAAPTRHGLAQLAAKARSAGMTRAAFQQSHGLTDAKVKECWSDAGVLFPTSIASSSL